MQGVALRQAFADQRRQHGKTVEMVLTIDASRSSRPRGGDVRDPIQA